MGALGVTVTFAVDPAATDEVAALVAVLTGGSSTPVLRGRAWVEVSCGPFRGEKCRQEPGPKAHARDAPRCERGCMDTLSPLDASFLHLEREVQALNVGSTLIFEGPAPSHDELCRAVEAMLPAFPRYRQHVRRVPLDLTLPRWVDDPGFPPPRPRRPSHRALARHGRRPAPRHRGRLVSAPLDLDRPLWRSWLVTGLRGGRFALVNTNHHAMIDGISGRRHHQRAVDAEPGRADPDNARGCLDARARAVGGTLAGLDASSTRSSPVGAVPTAGSGPACPRPSAESVAEVVGMAHFGEQLAHLELGLKGPLGPRRDWRWVRADLDAVKAVKNAYGGTVNDVVLAAIAGGFRALLLSRGQSVEGRTVRTHGPGVRPVTPTSTARWATGCRRCSRTCRWGRRTRSSASARSPPSCTRSRPSGTALGWTPSSAPPTCCPGSLFALGVKAWAHSPQRIFSTVTTNVPGPQVPLYLLGRRMTDLYPYIPLGADLRITIGIASYAGGLAWGVTGDHDSVPDLAGALRRHRASRSPSSSPSPSPSNRSEVRHARNG